MKFTIGGFFSPSWLWKYSYVTPFFSMILHNLGGLVGKIPYSKQDFLPIKSLILSPWGDKALWLKISSLGSWSSTRETVGNVKSLGGGIGWITEMSFPQLVNFYDSRKTDLKRKGESTIFRGQKWTLVTLIFWKMFLWIFNKICKWWNISTFKRIN